MELIHKNLAEGSYHNISINHIVEDDHTAGEGERYAIYLSGDQQYNATLPMGEEIEDVFVTTLKTNILNVFPDIDGITFTGGEPFHQTTAILNFLDSIRRDVREDEKTVWMVTDYTYEKLVKINLCKTLLEYVDILIDGEKRYAFPSRNIYKISDNQRIIDVQSSLKEGQVMLSHLNGDM